MIVELSFEEADAVCGGQFARTIAVEPLPGADRPGQISAVPSFPTPPCDKLIRGQPLCRVA